MVLTPVTTYVETPVTRYVETPVTTTIDLPVHATTVTDLAPRVTRTSYGSRTYSGQSYVSGSEVTGVYTKTGGPATSYVSAVYDGPTTQYTTIPTVTYVAPITTYAAPTTTYIAPTTTTATAYDAYNLGYRSYGAGSTLGSYGAGYSALPATATYGGYTTAIDTAPAVGSYTTSYSGIGGYGAGYGAGYNYVTPGTPVVGATRQSYRSSIGPGFY